MESVQRALVLMESVQTETVQTASGPRESVWKVWAQ
jgi:hypothetical protein